MATAFSTAIFFLLGSSRDYIIVNSDFSRSYLIAVFFMLAFPIISLFVSTKFVITGFYLKSTSLLMLASLFLMSLHNPILAAISLVAISAYSLIWWETSRTTESAVKKLFTFSAAMIFMYFVGSIIHFVIEPASYNPTFASIGEEYAFQPTGVPLLLRNGFIFITPYFQGTFSPLSFTIFTAISALLTENYFGIFKLLKGGPGSSRIQGSAYGAISLLSCQCEGGISLLPTMAVLLISIAMVPILVESFILLALTNFLINRYYLLGKIVNPLRRISSPGNRIPGLILAALLFLGTPMVETVGIYLGLISNMFFFFGIGILMTVASYYEVTVIGRLIGYSRHLNRVILAIMFTLASVLMFIWYIPAYTIPAIEQVSVFLLMNVTNIISGTLFGIVRLSSTRSIGQLLDEFIALMFGMPPIIVFYLSALAQIQVWPTFSITQQIEFGLGLWALILPFMWLTTNLSLNEARVNVTSPIIAKEAGLLNVE